MWSFFEGLLFHIVFIFRRRVHMPDGTLIGEVRVIQETISRLTVADHSSCVISEWVASQFLIWPDIGATVYYRVLPGIVNDHCWVHIISNSLLKSLECFGKNSWTLWYVKENLQFFSSDLNVPVIIIRIASIFVDCPFFFSSEHATKWKRLYRYILVIFCVEVRVCGNSVM